MLGQKLSTVTAKAQTTRHRIVSIISEPEHQLIVLDTPGLLKVRQNTSLFVGQQVYSATPVC